MKRVYYNYEDDKDKWLKSTGLHTAIFAAVVVYALKQGRQPVSSCIVKKVAPINDLSHDLNGRLTVYGRQEATQRPKHLPT